MLTGKTHSATGAIFLQRSSSTSAGMKRDIWSKSLLVEVWVLYILESIGHRVCVCGFVRQNQHTAQQQNNEVQSLLVEHFLKIKKKFEFTQRNETIMKKTLTCLLRICGLSEGYLEIIDFSQQF